MESAKRRVPGALALVTATLLTASGCGGAGGTAVQGTARPSTGTTSASAGAQGGAYGANRLRGALLTRYHSARPAAPASGSTVGALQDRLGLAGSLKTIKTKKRACLTAGPNLTSSKLREVPAAAVTLTDSRHGYTLGEVLFSTGTARMRQMVARRVPASCRRLTARVNGSLMRVALREFRLPHLGHPAHGVAMTVAANHRVSHSLTVMFAAGRYGGTLSLTGGRVSRRFLNNATRSAIQTAHRALR